MTLDLNLLSKEEKGLLNDILKRAKDTGLLLGDRTDLEMDLLATHQNGTPLDFQKLFNFNAFNFIHDILGIQRELNRSTGKLAFFLPRAARPEEVNA